MRVLVAGGLVGFAAAAGFNTLSTIWPMSGSAELLVRLLFCLLVMAAIAFASGRTGASLRAAQARASARREHER